MSRLHCHEQLTSSWIKSVAWTAHPLHHTSCTPHAAVITTQAAYSRTHYEAYWPTDHAAAEQEAQSINYAPGHQAQPGWPRTLCEGHSHAADAAQTAAVPASTAAYPAANAAATASHCRATPQLAPRVVLQIHRGAEEPAAIPEVGGVLLLPAHLSGLLNVFPTPISLRATHDCHP
mgnify:CR=1 FL=1